VKLLSLALANFQAHEKLNIEFGSGITTIWGPTDVGKSAILRALRWVALNDLGGDDFIREGGNKAIALLKVDVGEKGHPVLVRHILRTRGPRRTNLYQLDDKEFSAFGQGVPSDVTDLLNLNEINFQAQHDSPFWFSESAPEVSRKLNAVVDLSVIDSSLSYIWAQVRLAQERKTVTAERLAESKKQLEEILPQRARIAAFEEIKSKHEEQQKLAATCGRLEKLIDRARDTRIRAKDSLAQHTQGSALLELASNARKLQKRRDSLEALLKGARDQKLKAKSPPPFAPVELAYSKFNKATLDANNLEKLVERIEMASSKVARTARQAKESESELHSKTKGQRCPLCQKPM